jgi:hypothetical protein
MATASHSNRIPSPQPLRPLAKLGYELIPLHQPSAINAKAARLGKVPVGRDWRKRPAFTFEQAAEHMRGGGNIGVRLRPIDLVVDVDPRNFPVQSTSEVTANPVAALEARFGFTLRSYPTVETGGGGSHHYMRLATPLNDDVRLHNALTDFGGVEFKSVGRQVVAPGSVHPDSGMPYRWATDASLGGEVPFAPPSLVAALTRRTGTSGGPIVHGEPDWTPEVLAEFLANLDPRDFREHADWQDLAIACHAATLGLGLDEFVVWSTSDDQYAHHASRISYRWGTFDAEKPGGLTVRSLEKLARDRGFHSPQRPVDDFREVAQETFNSEQYGVIVPVDRLDLDGVSPKRRSDGAIADSFKTALNVMVKLQPTLRLAFDELRQSFVFRGASLPWAHCHGGRRLDEASAQLLRAFILMQFQVELSSQNVKDAAETVARTNPFHPIREYLDTRSWDGTTRIDTAFTELFGTEDTPYSRAVSRLFFLSAVRRIRQPGCKYDTMPILEGAQGVGKSSTIRALCHDPSWFTDASINLSPYGDAAKAAIELEGVWIYEMAELDALTRAQTTKMKAWLSRQRDDFKRPYDRFATHLDRSFVVIGTSNEDSYLTDTTGNRRYLPLTARRCDADGAAQLRDQLWAEAVVAEPTYGPLILPKARWHDAAEMQDARLNVHPWLDKLREILSNLGYDEETGSHRPVERVHGNTLLDNLKVDTGRASQKESKELRKLMPLLGYEYKPSIRVDGKPGSGYVLNDVGRQGPDEET